MNKISCQNQIKDNLLNYHVLYSHGIANLISKTVSNFKWGGNQ